MQSAGKLDFLNDNDATIKFWVPQIVADAIKDASSFHGRTMAAYLREHLYQHCYGEYIFIYLQQLKLRDSEDAVFHQEHVSHYVSIKDPVYWVPHLGKNIFPIRLELPAKTKMHLEKLADHYDIALSQYIREVVISRVFGQGMLPQRPTVNIDEDQIRRADQWTSGDPSITTCAALAADNGKNFYFDDE